MKDLAGQRFGRLVAVRPTEMRKNGFVVWECKCDCGNTVFLKRGALTGGNTKSCGCLNKEKIEQHSASRTNDLTGQRFGRLTAVRLTDIRKGGTVVWECLCDCGNTTLVQSNALKYGNTRSCGCLKQEGAAQARSAKREMGAQGARIPKNNTSGYRGVGYRAAMNKYVVSIGFRMGSYYLGVYEEIDDAIDVRKKAETLIRDKGTLFYEQWKKKADAEPDWAKEHPIRFCVTKDGEQGYLVSFAPEL